MMFILTEDKSNPYHAALVYQLPKPKVVLTTNVPPPHITEIFSDTKHSPDSATVSQTLRVNYHHDSHNTWITDVAEIILSYDRSDRHMVGVISASGYMTAGSIIKKLNTMFQGEEIDLLNIHKYYSSPTYKSLSKLVANAMHLDEDLLNDPGVLGYIIYRGINEKTL